jgi:hypothetical protein
MFARKIIKGVKNMGRVLKGSSAGAYVSQDNVSNSLVIFAKPPVRINKNTVESYKIVHEETRKSVTSAIVRAALGGLVLGPVGLAAGVTARSVGTHTVALYFKDGKKCLVELDDGEYKLLLSSMF